MGELSWVAEVTLDITDGPPEDLRGWRYTPRVYFALAPIAGLVKIGTTERLADRMQELRLMSPVPLELIGHVPGGFEREQEYHRTFADARAHGEWFHYTDAVATRIGTDNLIATWNRISPASRRGFLEKLREAAGATFVISEIPGEIHYVRCG
jgi:hypothetical protein